MEKYENHEWKVYSCQYINMFPKMLPKTLYCPLNPSNQIQNSLVEDSLSSYRQ